MTSPERRPAAVASSGPVGHTEARHVALATVADGSVHYDREHAAWSLRRPDSDIVRTVRGTEQRTLRDLLDFGLIGYWPQSGPAAVQLTTRGQGALTLWGDQVERLQGHA